MNVQQIKFDLENSKENLIDIILKNKGDLHTSTVANAIKEYLRNHEKYKMEKNRILEFISNSGKLDKNTN